MKPLSTDRDPAAGAARAVRFDRPLVRGAAGTSWGDAETDRRVAEAIQRGLAEGRAQGYALGWAQGRHAAAEAAQAEEQQRLAADAAHREAQAAQLRLALDALGRAARGVQVCLAPAWEEVADALTDAALQLTRAVLARELDGLDDATLAAVRAAVRTLGAEPGETVVHLPPADLAALTANGPVELPDGVRLAADPGLAAGEVVAASPVQQLRLALPAALAAAEEVLRG